MTFNQKGPLKLKKARSATHFNRSAYSLKLFKRESISKLIKKSKCSLMITLMITNDVRGWYVFLSVSAIITYRNALSVEGISVSWPW